MDLSNGNYYMIDLLTYFPISILMVMSLASNKLSDKYPHSNIFNSAILFNVLGILIINFLINTFSVLYYVNSPIHIPSYQIGIKSDELNDRISYVERFGMCAVCSFAVLAVGMIYSRGYPFKKEWY